MQSGAVLVCGTVAFDVIARVTRLPQPDEVVLADAMVQRFGGCGGNVARGLARLGHTPRLLSAVGPDFQGSAYEAALIEEGVDLSELVRDPQQPTARALILGTPSGSQMTVYHEGAMPAAASAGLDAASLGHFGAGELTSYPRLMARCQRCVFDPGQETFHHDTGEVLAAVEACDILVVNHHEAQALAGQVDGIHELAGMVEALIITDAQGQDIHTAGGTQRVRALEAEAVDATGGGDAYCAGLLHGLEAGWELAEASRFGSAVAACAVEAEGAQEGLPTLEEAVARYEGGYGGTPP